MRRTTILADEDLLLEARQLAVRQGTTFTALVQQALREYVAAHRPPERHISFIGLGDSGEADLSVSNGWDEEILARELHPTVGWAPSAPRAAEGGRGHPG